MTNIEMYTVGMMYKDGVGTEISFPQFKYYLWMAVDCRNKDATALVTKWDRRDSKRKNTARADFGNGF